MPSLLLVGGNQNTSENHRPASSHC